jgi:hypothetical protein
MSPECIITGADLIDTAHRCAVHGDLHRLGDALIFNACLNVDGEALWRALPPQSDLVISARDFFERRGVIVIRAADAEWSREAAEYIGRPGLAR